MARLLVLSVDVTIAACAQTLQISAVPQQIIEQRLGAYVTENLETLRILHSPYDRLENVHADQYYRTYRLVPAYLAVLDQNLD